MQRIYCDFCGDELIKKNIFNYSVQHKLIKETNKGVCVTATLVLTCEEHHAIVENGRSQPDICKYCVIDAINKIDDRPKGVKHA